jgi:hypothetical protein
MSEKKSIHVIAFDGKQENWQQFKLNCLAKAKYLGYHSIFDEGEQCQAKVRSLTRPLLKVKKV